MGSSLSRSASPAVSQATARGRRIQSARQAAEAWKTDWLNWAAFLEQLCAQGVLWAREDPLQSVFLALSKRATEVLIPCRSALTQLESHILTVSILEQAHGRKVKALRSLVRYSRKRVGATGKWVQSECPQLPQGLLKVQAKYFAKRDGVEQCTAEALESLIQLNATLLETQTGLQSVMDMLLHQIPNAQEWTLSSKSAIPDDFPRMQTKTAQQLTQRLESDLKVDMNKVNAWSDLVRKCVKRWRRMQEHQTDHVSLILQDLVASHDSAEALVDISRSSRGNEGQVKSRAFQDQVHVLESWVSQLLGCRHGLLKPDPTQRTALQSGLFQLEIRLKAMRSAVQGLQKVYKTAVKTKSASGSLTHVNTLRLEQELHRVNSMANEARSFAGEKLLEGMRDLFQGIKESCRFGLHENLPVSSPSYTTPTAMHSNPSPVKPDWRKVHPTVVIPTPAPVGIAPAAEDVRPSAPPMPSFMPMPPPFASMTHASPRILKTKFTSTPQHVEA